jgi:hypothetical protein
MRRSIYGSGCEPDTGSPAIPLGPAPSALLGPWHMASGCQKVYIAGVGCSHALGLEGSQGRGVGIRDIAAIARRNAVRDETAIVAVLQNGMLFLGVLSTAKWRVAVMTHQSGRLAQLGERCVRNAEVGGSIPPPSTK